MNELTHLDLFSGIGGFALAAKWAGFRTIGFCEIDPYCQRVLSKNFLGRARIYSDIFDLDGTKFRGVDLITGGFPCQPFSVAGERRGAADDRAIWPQMFRVISEARPAWVLGENVPGIIAMELDNVLSDLEGIGYACRPFVIPACAVDARHRRNRLWVVAHAGCVNHNGGSSQRGGPQSAGPRDRTARPGEHAEHVAQSNESGSQRVESGPQESGQPAQLSGFLRGGTSAIRWLPEPPVGRVAHGIPSRVDRLKGLGNAIVPQVAYQILAAIAEIT